MGSGKKKAVKPTPKAATAGQPSKDASTQDLQKKQKKELEDLTLTTHPFKTLQLFCFAILQYTRQSVQYVLTKGSWFMTVIVLMLVLALVILNIDGPHEKHVQEFIRYTRFVLWWVALGVASSIGLGSGLHTFVLYLGPHIAFFTIKAMKCGRIDLKRAPYDTIQLESGPSWLEKDCSEFGPPIFSSPPGSLVRVPVGSVLPQVYLEAILWGLGTALGELPPYFISRAASLSGSKVDAMDDLDAAPSRNDGLISANLKKIKLWFLSHSQHLNFGTILVLASVPNPLFDLAGIMCGQFGIPFWKFFLPTLFGKAIIKTYIQTVFIISLCNNQLLEWVENEFIWVLGHIPGFSSKVPYLITKLHMVQKKYLSASPHSPAPHLSDGTAKPWKLSFTLVWNTFIWLMLMNFFAKIVTSTAQRYLKLQQLELHNRKSTKNSELESEA